MGRTKIYASNVERQRAYRDRKHACRADTLLPKRLDNALWAHADGDQALYGNLVRAVLQADPRLAHLSDPRRRD